MDHLKPAYHLRPGKNWINDPNAPVFWKDRYHMFFQHNPNEPVWGDIHWGHAESRDLVHWTVLPDAIAPGPEEYDKKGIYSGGAAVKDDILHLFYTAAEPQAQCLAVSRPDGTFEKHPRNPLIPEPPDGYDTPDFRDPFLWKDRDRYNMILASGYGGRGIIFLYTSLDLLEWKYRGELYSEKLPAGVPALECPLYFRLRGRDYLVFSPFDRSRYLCGRIAGNRFEAQTSGILDQNSGWYAANTLETVDGRRVLIAWLREERDVGSQKRAGWSGCLSLPRECTAGGDGRLLVKPLAELTSLRSAPVSVPETVLNRRATDLGLIPAGAELDLHMRMSMESGFEIRLFEDESRQTGFIIRYGSRRIRLEDRLDSPYGKVPAKEEHCVPGSGEMRIRVFIDGSVIEVFVDERIALSSRLYPGSGMSRYASVRKTGDGETVCTGTVYEMLPSM